MVATPNDIQNKSFNVRMRGFDQNQVKEHLGQIQKEFDQISKKNQELETQLNMTHEKLSEYQEKHDSLNRSIITAQDAADRVKEEADLKADEIVNNAEQSAKSLHEEAEENADRLLKDAVEKARRIERETEELRKQTMVFRKRLRTMMETQLDVINDEKWDQILNFESINQVNTDTITSIENDLNDKGIEFDEVKVSEGKNNGTTDAASEDRFGDTPAVEIPDTSE